MIDCQRALRVHNLHCSNFERAAGFADSILEVYPALRDPEAKPIETSIDPGRTIEAIQKTVRPGDLVLVAGGDSTVATTGQAIAGLKDVALLPLWGGNGDDGAHDLNGRATARPAPELVRSGRITTVHFLDVLVDAELRRTMNYFEVGWDANFAQLINSDRWRSLPGYHNNRLRLLYEATALPVVAARSRRFPLTEADVTREVLSYLVNNARYMAKLARFPTSLDRHNAVITTVANHLELPAWGLRATTDTLRGEQLDPGQKRTLLVGRTVLAHTDAEPFVVEKGSSVEIGLSDVSFSAVSTRHPKHALY